MNRTERAIVFTALIYMLLYVPLFIAFVAIGNDQAFFFILPFHFLGMALNFAAFIVTLIDLYKRPFASANAKLTWGLLILMTGGIGLVIYIFKYALKPRTAAGYDLRTGPINA